jgi:processive 1,2-diacylglycerol beta-glucosyltransferase
MRWLILTSSTGTGHNMRADSLRQWATHVFGDSIEIRVHHVLENTHGLYKFGVELYNIIQRRAPRLHHLYFNYLELAGMHRRGSKILGRDTFSQVVRDYRPDCIISVHAHTNHGFFDLARAALPDNPPRCITYCGELFGGYGFSRHWTNPRVDGFIGASPEVCAASQAVGTPAARVLFGGFLLRQPFYASAEQLDRDADSFARELGLDRRTFTVLLSTGQAGANNHLPILRALAASGKKLQVVALCSKNTAVREAIETFAASNPTLTIRALGHTDRIPALKRLCAVVVARPGTGATSEAIQLGTPLIHNGIGGVMPQELITVQYCRQHACARFGSTPKTIAGEIIDLLDHPEKLASLRRNLQEARPAGHPVQIIRWIANIRP